MKPLAAYTTMNMAAKSMIKQTSTKTSITNTPTSTILDKKPGVAAAKQWTGAALDEARSKIDENPSPANPVKSYTELVHMAVKTTPAHPVQSSWKEQE